MPLTRSFTHLATLALTLLAACEYTTAAPSTSLFVSNPCSPTGTVSVLVNTATRIDCSNGGTTFTLEGGGASYLVVPQFVTDAVANNWVYYSLATGNLAAITASPNGAAAALRAGAQRPSASTIPSVTPNRGQIAFDHLMLARERQFALSAFHGMAALRAPTQANITQSLPALGSIRPFRVLNSLTGSTFATANAKLVYIGSSILLYVDTLAPANGFTPTALQSFGVYFDSTLYAIDTTAFGGPADIDGNGRVIMLMSPAVNSITPSATCTSQGYVAGFFNPEDFNNSSDPNSNVGEVFYSIVPDSLGTYSCAHSVASVTSTVPAVFLHELQHLIDFSQHVVVSGGDPGSSWLDEGLSITAEELGSVYYEQKCPPPSCRTNSAQLFPDSSQGFIQSFLGDSYAYAFLPDTASITLHSDDELGFDWRGGVWLLARYLGDQVGPGFYKNLEKGPSDGILDIQQASGQSFPALFANFGLALYTDSLPGLARTTAPLANRFTSRNLSQIWARWSVTNGGPGSGFPTMPLLLYSITTDTSSSVMTPGTMSFYRLDTAAGASTVTVRFSGPGGSAFPASLKPQIAIFRLPAGQ
ncbi:MAG: hypothetical protein ACHQX4_08375 [Gemmatimonadales bacterium]